jgi:hypothetical protein
VAFVKNLFRPAQPPILQGLVLFLLFSSLAQPIFIFRLGQGTIRNASILKLAAALFLMQIIWKFAKLA